MLANVSQNGSIGILGAGSYVPDRVMTNDELSKLVDTSDEWITERTGIKQRHIAEPGQAASDLALPAARQALEQAGMDPAKLDLVVVATAAESALVSVARARALLCRSMACSSRSTAAEAALFISAPTPDAMEVGTC